MTDKPTHPGFMVWSPTGQPPRYRHETFASARAESERLARLRPGQSFFVLAPITVAYSDPPHVMAVLVEPDAKPDLQAQFEHPDRASDFDDGIPF